MQNIIQVTSIEKDVTDLLAKVSYDKLFILTDDVTEKLCLPLLGNIPEIQEAEKIIIRAGEENKNINTLADIWKFLSGKQATRRSLLINLGGGMITDIGGFAASTFKRGINFINMPTTLLAAVDAAIGGKTGINFNGLKNEIGCFNPAGSVLIYSGFFKSLDSSNFFSGYAEMLKHALIDSEKEWVDILTFNTDVIDYKVLDRFILNSIAIKEKIVKQDPYEKGIRKALNFGHTTGHAIESLSQKTDKPVLHGYAVAWGIICELYLSYKTCGFPKEKLWQTVCFIKDNYGQFPFDCREYDQLHELMTHDKKNVSADKVNFTLLSDTGQIRLNQTASKEEILEALDFLRENAGL